MEDNDKGIKIIYEEFSTLLQEPRFKNLIGSIALQTNAKDPHEKGAAVILYTPWTFEPDLMLIGTNPSWFHKRARGESPSLARMRAKQNLAQVELKLPTINSYIEHDHVFSMELRSYFARNQQMNLLEKCVGANQFWIQTGSDSNVKLESYQDRAALKELERFCRKGTRRLVELTRPKNLWLFGIPAKKCFADFDFAAHGIDKVIKTLHPSQRRPIYKARARNEINEALLSLCA